MNVLMVRSMNPTGRRGTHVKVEMVLDIPCVWSYFGFTRLRRARDRVLAQGGQVELAFAPFELIPDATVEGEPKVEVMRRTFGDDVQVAIDGITQFAATQGLEFRHVGAVIAKTTEAHRLIAVASAQGLGEPMVERLFRAHHTDELNVADPATLRRLADEVGVAWSDDGAEALRARLDRVRRSGVRGVPVFRFGDGSELFGDQSEDALFEALGRAS
jgi:predicted DsbA family dithiol-disulfide isomerase